MRRLGQVPMRRLGTGRIREIRCGTDTGPGSSRIREIRSGIYTGDNHNPSMILGKSRSDNNTTKGTIIQR